HSLLCPASHCSPPRRSSDLDKRMLALLEQAKAAGVKPRSATAARLDGMAGGMRHQGVVALAQANVLAVDVDEVLDHLEDRGEPRSEEHTSELQSRGNLVCRL